MKDIALKWKNGVADIALDAGDIALDNGLESAVIISLFGDGLASPSATLPDGATNRRGWWGGCSGSGLWQHTRAKNTQANALALADEARRALAWLTKDGLATSLEVEAVRQAGQIALQVRVKGVASAFKGGLYAV